MTASAADTVPASTDRLLDELRAGRVVVLLDGEGPDDAGDLVCAAAAVTPEIINFMAVHARGLICLGLTAEACTRLQLEPQGGFDPDGFTGTAFMTSIDARHNIGTGISASDRAATIRLAVDPGCAPTDLARGGHVFTVRARPGGVLVRAGTTEAGVDLATFAGLPPAAVMCALHDAAGEPARGAAVRAFAAGHNLPVGTIADLIRFRLRRERLIRRLDTHEIETPAGRFDVVVYQSVIDELPHLALCAGGVGRPGSDGRVVERDEPVMVRVHSECLTGEVFGSLRCECGPQLDHALRMIAAEGKGVLVYLRQEGRGIGLAAKLHAYRLQEDGLDTVEANLKLGLPADKRDYGIGSQILRDLGLRRLRVLSNNPQKIYGLQGYGLEVVERLPCRVPPGRYNREYLQVKRDKLGHLLPDE